MPSNSQSNLLFLHGFTQTGAVWQPITNSLSKDRLIYTPDIRGHGTNGSLRPINFAACIKDILKLADRKATLIGYSMGGRLALLTALTAPKQIDKLVLISTTAGIRNAKEREQRKQTDQLLAKRLEEDLTIDQFAKEWGSQPLFADQPASVASLMQRERLKNEPTNLAAALRGIGTGMMNNMWNHLPQLELPVDLVIGERDHKFNLIAQEMNDLTPNSELHIIKNAGHACCFEQPESIVNLLQNS